MLIFWIKGLITTINIVDLLIATIDLKFERALDYQMNASFKI